VPAPKAGGRKLLVRQWSETPPNVRKLIAAPG